MTSHARAVFAHCPRGPAGFGRAVWLAGSLICIGTAVAMALRATQDIAVPSQETYAGTLRLDTEALTVDLPRDVPLGAIHVAMGDPVTRGQPVASLDRQALDTRIAEIRRDVLSAMVLRACLQADGSEMSGLDVPDEGLDPSLETQVSTALDECRLFHDEDRNVRTRLETRIAGLTSDIELLQASRKLVLDTPTRNTAEKRGIASKAIALAAQSNQLSAVRASLNAELRDHAAEVERLRLDRISALSDRLAASSEQEDWMERHLADVDLVAPEDGVVVRVRRIQPGTEVDQPQPIVEIAPAGRPSYRVDFDVPDRAADEVRTGSEVKIQLLGQDGTIGDLTGRVEYLAPSSSPERVQVSVGLSPESADDLTSRPIAMSLRSRASAASVRVRQEDALLRDSVGRVVRTNIALIADGWRALLSGRPGPGSEEEVDDKSALGLRR